MSPSTTMNRPALSPVETGGESASSWMREVEDSVSPWRGEGETRHRHWFQVLIALLWGSITAFAMASESYGAMVQSGGLAVAWLLSLICSGCAALLAWTQCLAGLLLAAHIAVACVSGFLADSETEAILRYLALLPAFSILLAVVMKGETATAQFRVGLTLAGFSLVVFHLFYLEPGSLLDPSARLTVFLNTNSTGFMAVMTAVSAIDLSCSARTKWRRILWGTIFALCVVIWLSTKSRTAFLALVGGVLTLGVLRYHVIEVLRFQFSRRPLLIGVLLLGALAVAVARKDFFVNVLSLEDEYRSVESGTGRYEIWRFILTELWPEAPWLGVGPGYHGELVLDATGSTNAHNGMLMALAETGLCGAIPLLLLVVLCLRSIGRSWRDPKIIWAASLFVAGLSESMGEVMLFSIGSPGSLLFMLAVASLALQGRFNVQGSRLSVDDRETSSPAELPTVPVA